MIKILMVTGSLRVGGLEKVAISCVQYSNRKMVHFDFLVFGNEDGGYEEEVKTLGCQIFRVDTPSKGYKAFYNNVRDIMINNGPYDIVHSHTFLNSGIVLKAAYDCGIPKRIAHSHSIKRKGHISVLKMMYNLAMKLMLSRYSTDFCACSVAAGNYLFGVKKQSQLNIIPNIVDFDRFCFSETNRKEIRQELEILDEDKVVGFVGHLTPVKNPFFFVKIAETFKNSPNIKFLMIGDGPLKDQIIKVINEKQLQTKIVMTGIRDDVPKIMSAFDLLVCPSLNEGLGIVLLEAQANGLVSIAEKSAIVKEVSELNGCVLIDGFDNLMMWKDAILQFVNKGHSDELAVSVRESIFSINRLKSVLCKIYGYANVE